MVSRAWETTLPRSRKEGPDEPVPSGSIRSGLEELSQRGRAARADWSVREASITALLGRNGAGKTTALKCLMGLLRPSSGEMTIFGEDTRRASSQTRERVGYVSEVSGLDPRLTIHQLIRLTRPLYARWDDALAEDLLDRLELDPSCCRPISSRTSSASPIGSR